MPAGTCPGLAGLVLLTGGAGARFGARKHVQAHPDGGTWASRLVDLFLGVLGPGPVRVLGDPVLGRPELTRLDDPREGPARAVSRWASGEREAVVRWWVVACDQVAWDPQSLRAWHAAAVAADPAGAAWVLAEIEGEVQPLGGFLGGGLLPVLARSTERRLLALARSMPHLDLPWDPSPFVDLDDPQSFRTWLERRGSEGR